MTAAVSLPTWLVIGDHGLRSNLQRRNDGQVTVIECPADRFTPQLGDAHTYTLNMADWPVMPTRTMDQSGRELATGKAQLSDLLAGYHHVPLGLIQPAGVGSVRLYPQVDTYIGSTRYLRVPNPAVPEQAAVPELLRVIDEHFLRLNNYLCFRVKLQPDVELEHKFTFVNDQDVHVLARRTLADAGQGAFARWIPEFREEIQQWDFLNHVYAIVEPVEDAGYVSFIPTTDGRHTVKRKIFAEDTDERPELRSRGVEVGADLAGYIRDTMGLTPAWHASFRRIRYDVSVEHVQSGNVFGIAYDRSTRVGDDGRPVPEAPELLQCEIEYIYSQSIAPIDYDSVRADLADLRVSVANWLRQQDVEFYEKHESKLTWLRNQHVIAL